ncbi:hypothetical protein SCMC78_04650 [Streptomyces sp. CMC78]|uniref:Integral membrane protein n=1 Tax=Streptomyces sp. CMC78 TaxID=3231512 RepID=A0AB33KFS4_9ACTN
MILAGEWYENGTVWAAAAVPVALVVGLLAVWATLKANNPKLRLGYELAATTDLLGHAGASSLTVTHNGGTLASPHIALIVIANEGRRDIVGSMFHNGDPLTFNLGRPALGVLDVQSDHASAPTPAVSIDPSGMVAVAPSHLPRKQKLRISVVLDGPTEPKLRVVGSLVNVSLRERRNASAELRQAYTTGITGAAFAVLTSAVAAVGLLMQ